MSEGNVIKGPWDQKKDTDDSESLEEKARKLLATELDESGNPDYKRFPNETDREYIERSFEIASAQSAREQVAFEERLKKEKLKSELKNRTREIENPQDAK